MNGHDEYLELLAASIDFGLTEEEVARLNYHLASCPECRRAATELRGQNAVIATTPIAPLAPARSEQILRAALRKPATKPRWGMLAVAALLATLGGGVLFAGVRLITDDDPAPDQSPPIVAEVSAPPSELPAEESVDPGAPPPVDGPRVTPNPGDDEPPDLDPIEFEFPRPYSPEIASIRVAPLADGRLWVSFQDGNGTVLALLDSQGAGSPMAIPGAEDCVPLAVADGSVRLLCQYGDDVPENCDIGCYDEQVFAYSASLDELPGFPTSLQVDQAGSVDRHDARVVGTSVVVGFMEAFEEGDDVSTTSRLITVGEDGSVTRGFPLDDLEFCCAISPDGLGFGKDIESRDDGTQISMLAALGPDGLVDGWPLPIEGTASGPAFAPDGDVYVTTWLEEGSSILRIHGENPVSTVDVPDSITWDPTFDGPLPPLVDERGRTSIVADGRILSLDATGAPVPGFPYEPETSLVERGGCPAPDTGCQEWVEPPRLAPRGLIYAIESPPQGKGERLTAINTDGTVRSGWPRTLQREGATWDSVTIGENRRAYAVAIEPEPNNESSISVLAFAPNGTREWISVLVEP